MNCFKYKLCAKKWGQSDLSDAESADFINIYKIYNENNIETH